MAQDPTLFSFQSRLGSGEKLLWQGQPAQGFRPSEHDSVFSIIFCLIWAGFAVFWNVGVWTADAPAFFRLWGLPFLVAAAYITFGRFLIDRYQRKRTRYGVTNQRVLIARTDKDRLRALDIRHLPTIDLTERADGTGTIRFDIDPYAGLLMGRRQSPFGLSASDLPRFIGIEGVRRVYDIIRKAAEAPEFR